jgi:WD40 repeat protein
LESRLVLSTDPYLYAASFGNNSIERFEELSGVPVPAKHRTGGTLVKHDSGGVDHPLSCVLGPQDHDLYVTSLETDQVMRYSGTTGKFLGVFIDSSLNVLHNPSGLLFGPDGNIYVANADPATSNIVYFDPSGNYLGVYAQLSTMGGATGMVFGPDGKLYIGTRFSNGVVRTDGSTITDFVTAGSGGLNRTAGLVFGPDGNFYVGSQTSNNILKFNGITGAYMSEFVTAGSGGLVRPAGMLFGPYGDLYVADADSNAIIHYNGATGAFINILASQQEDPNLSGPRQIFFGNTNPTTLNYVPRRRDAGPGDGKSGDIGTSLTTASPASHTVATNPTGSVEAISPEALVRIATWDGGGIQQAVVSSTAASEPLMTPADTARSLDDRTLDLFAQNLGA